MTAQPSSGGTIATIFSTIKHLNGLEECDFYHIAARSSDGSAQHHDSQRKYEQRNHGAEISFRNKRQHASSGQRAKGSACASDAIAPLVLRPETARLLSFCHWN
jgi:hypothetical protein